MTPSPYGALSDELEGLIERVSRATGELSVADCIMLWCMSAGCKLVEHKNGERGLDGYWDHHILVDDSGGRKNVIVPEWQFPDRSVDAALALVDRLLPGCAIRVQRNLMNGNMFCEIQRKDADGKFDVWQDGGNRASFPLAIISALLAALRSLQTGNAE